MQAKKQRNQTWKKQTGSKLGKEYCQGCMRSLCLFNLHAEYIMQNAGLDKSNWNQDCREKYQQPQICKYTTLMSKPRGTKKTSSVKE